jgi:hypothetical protein
MARAWRNEAAAWERRRRVGLGGGKCARGKDGAKEDDERRGFVSRETFRYAMTVTTAATTDMSKGNEQELMYG